MAHPVALGALGAAAGPRGPGRRRGLPSVPPRTLAVLAAPRDGTPGRLAPARVPLALGLWRGGAHVSGFAEPGFRVGGSRRRHLRAPADRHRTSSVARRRARA